MINNFIPFAIECILFSPIYSHGVMYIVNNNMTQMINVEIQAANITPV